MSVWQRAGTAYEQGAGAGSSVDIAQSTTSNDQAKVAGYLASQTGAGAKPGYLTSVTTQQHGPSALGVAVGDVLAGAMHYANVPVQGVADYYKANARFLSGVADQKDFTWRDAMHGFYYIPGFGYVDPEFRAVAADPTSKNGSVFQNELIAFGGVNPEQQVGNFSILDDPARAQENQDFYSAARMRFTVGVADAMFNVFADPLVLAGAGVGAARKASQTLKAADVTAIANRTIATADLTSKQRRGRGLIDALIAETEPGKLTDGTVSALARTKFLGQSTDAGSIAYLMGRANSMTEFAGDAAARIAFKRDLLTAGMGDQASLARIGERSKVLQAELYAMGEDISGARFVNRLAKPDADQATIFDEMHTDQSWIRGIEAQRADVEKQFEAMNRVQKLGSPAGTTTQGVGGLKTISGVRAAKRDLMKQYGWVQSGRYLNGIHVMSGIHVPQTFRLSADDAPEVFDAALRRAQGVVDSSTLAKLRDDFYATVSYGQTTKVDRAAVLQRFNAEVEKGLAAKHGKELGQIRELMMQARKRRNEELGSLHRQAYQAKPGDVLYHRTDDATLAYSPEAAQAIANSGGVLNLDKPVLASQLEDWVSLLDTKVIDRWIAKQSPGSWNAFLRKADTGWQLTESALTAANRLWKFSALFRLAYPARVQIDSQARLLATLGPLRYFATAAKGTGNMLYNNLKRVDTATLDDFVRRFDVASKLDDIERRLLSGDHLESEAKALTETARDLRVKLAENTPVKLTGNTVRVKGTEMQRLLGKRTLTKDKTRLTGDITDPYQNLGEFRDVASKMDARMNTIGIMSEGNGQMLRQIRGSRDWDWLAGDNPKWAEAYLRQVNRQVRQDQVGRMILEGRSDDEILKWLDTTSAGRSYWRGMAPSWAHNPLLPLGEDSALGREAWLIQARAHVNTLVPNEQAASLVSKRELTLDDVKAMFTDPTTRPQVPGEIVDGRKLTALTRAYEGTQETFFRFANDIPEQMMARHPFYQDAFKGHMQEMIASTGVDSSTLTLKQVNELRRQAALLARRDVGKVMFDTSKSTQLGYHLRFLSPFYAAWWDTMTKWGNLMGTHLELAPITLKVFAAPNAAGMVFDNDGHLINAKGEIIDYVKGPDGKTYGTGQVIGHANVFDSGNIVVPMPSWFTQSTGQSELKISKGSLNVIFQGDPFWLPGPGPMAQIPFNEAMVRAFPEVGPELASTPIGRYLTAGFGLTNQSPLEQATPQWVRNLWTATRATAGQGYGDARFDQAYVLEYQSLLAEVEQGKRDPMSMPELKKLAANRTRNKFIMQFFGSWGVPVSTRTQGRMQFYLDRWHEYQTKYGLDAYSQFIQDYPEYGDLTISLSANETGVNATIPAWDSVQQYRSSIADNPQYGWFFAGADNLLGDFNENVYAAQGTQIGSGSTATWRSNKDPMESIRQNQINQGWNRYWQISEKVSQALASAGLKSGQNAAKPVIETKQALVQQLAKDNPAWGEAYNAGVGGDKAINFLSYAAEQVKQHPELGERSDIKALNTYLRLRRTMQSALEAIGVKSINSETAKERGLKDAWDAVTAQLVASDIGFSQMWTRGGLEHDDLTGSVY